MEKYLTSTRSSPTMIPATTGTSTTTTTTTATAATGTTAAAAAIAATAAAAGGVTTAAAAATAGTIAGTTDVGPGPATLTAVPASVCKSGICSSYSLPDIKLIDANMSDEKLNQEEHLLVLSINSIRCKNYGMNSDVVHKYQYSDIVGQRYNDLDLKCIAKEEDSSREGCCIVSPPLLYRKGPLVASIVSQYGLEKPFDQNKMSQKIVRNCPHESFRQHLRQDTTDNRTLYFNAGLQKLANAIIHKIYPDIDKVIFPIGIGRRSVDETWLCRYYELLKKFSCDIKLYGVRCYIAVRKSYLYAIERYVNKRCSDVAKEKFIEMKCLQWKDIDEKWFNEIFSKKEVNLYENIQMSNTLRSNDRVEGRVAEVDVLNDEGVDVPEGRVGGMDVRNDDEGVDVAGNIRFDKDHDYLADLLNQIISYDDFQTYLDC